MAKQTIPSSRIVLAKSKRANQNQVSSGTNQWSLVVGLRLFGIVASVGFAIIAHNSAANLWGANVVNLTLGLAITFACVMWVRAKLRARSKGETPVDILVRLQSTAMDISSQAYHPVSARNSAIRQAKELTLVIAALENSRDRS